MRLSRTLVCRVAMFAWLVILLGPVAGCSSTIGHLMVDAPNQHETAESLGVSTPEVLAFWGIDRQFRVDVGPPEASMLMWVIDPITKNGEQPQTPKGTILVLHGFRDEMEWFSGKARDLARHGYRAVLVDFRGQGSSTGDYVTYGVQESKDLTQVIDALDRQGELAGNVGVWGMSFGASTAIMTAARDARVRAVVAVAPFESMRTIVPHFVRLLVPVDGWLKSDAEIDSLVTDRATTAGFDADESDMSQAAAAGRSPLLLVHGAWDVMVPASHSERIELAARQADREVRRVVVPCTGHISIYFDLGGDVERESVAWFDRWLCPTQDGLSLEEHLALTTLPAQLSR